MATDRKFLSPLVSVITPCFNAAAYIGRTIESVRAQTFSNWEHLIVDDGSTDDSAAIVETYATADGRLRLIRQPNRGVCNARNNGFAACSPDSEYLLFLDADDCLEPEMLQVITDYLARHPAAGLAYCNYVHIDDADQVLETNYPSRYVPVGLGLRRLDDTYYLTPFIAVFCAAPIWPSNALLRRAIYEQTPGWDEVLGQHHEDLDLFIYFALLSEVHFIPQKFHRYRRRSGQSSSDLLKHQIQGLKFDKKWSSPQRLTDEHQQLIYRAWHFQRGRLQPYHRVLAGHQCLRQRNFRQALRHYLWALLHYIKSFGPKQWWLP